MAPRSLKIPAAFSWASALLIATAGILQYFGAGFPDLTAIVGVLLAAVAIIAGGSASGNSGPLRTPRRVLVAAAVPALVPLLPIIAHAGLPAFQHDWRWPLEAASLQHWWPGMLLAWDSSGWGARTQLPGINPAIAAISLLSYVLPPKAVLVVMLFACLAAGAVGAASVAARVVGDAVPALLAAVAYACNPVVINKLGAGHTLFFVAYATLPWMFLVMSSEGSALRRTGAGGLLLALSATQPQFLVYNAIVCWIGSSVSLARRNWPAAAGAVLLGAVAVAPAIAANFAGPSSDFRYPTIPWEVTLSSSPAAAIGWDGYFARYFLAAGGPVSAIPYVVLTALAVLVAWNSRYTRGLGVLMVVGLLIIMGLRGPLAALDRWMLEHLTFIAAFRELYHAAPLVAFPASVLAASAVAMLRGTARAVTAFALMIALLATSAHAASWSLPSFNGTSVLAEAGAYVKDEGSGVASLPLTHPVGIAPYFGLDPSAWSEPPNSAYWMYEPSQPALAIGAAFQCGSLHQARLLSIGSVRAAVVHVGWRSGIAANPSIPVRSPARCLTDTRAAFPHGTATTTVASGDQIAVFGPASNGAWISGSLPVATRVDDACDGRMPADFTDAVVLAEPLALDPSVSWVPARPYYVEHVAFAFAPSIGTYTSSSRPLEIHSMSARTSLLVWTPTGAILEHDRNRIGISPDTRVRWLTVNAGSDFKFIPRGETALFGWSPGLLPAAKSRCSSRPLHWERSGRASWNAQLTTAGEGTLVFRERFDPGWSLRVDSCDVKGHFMVDGYSNGWYLRCAGRGIATASFEPQRSLDEWLVVSLVAWSVCAVLWTWDGLTVLRRTLRS